MAFNNYVISDYLLYRYFYINMALYLNYHWYVEPVGNTTKNGMRIYCKLMYILSLLYFNKTIMFIIIVMANIYLKLLNSLFL